MTITRINEFQAKDGQEEALKDHLVSFQTMIESSEGNLSCQMLQQDNEPAHFVVIEVWESIEAHQASTQNIPAEAIEKAMQMLAGPPKGMYYRLF